LLQETLIKAWQGYGAYRERGRARAWLFTIARRALIDWTRGRSSEIATEPGTLERHADPAADPLERTVARGIERAVLTALVAQPEERRSVFLMRHHTPMTFREIAEALDIPLGTALSHMHHVTRDLRETLAPHAPGRAAEAADD
jgi:RNA polymerase sigma-70 factor (ECF subfamily)